MSETYSAGIATAYGSAKRAGYTGSYADFCAAMAAITAPSTTASGLPAGSDPTAAYNDGVFAFGIPKGDKGDTGATGPQGPEGATGATGNGIASIAKTATVGKTDTYTITYTDGTTTTFDVTNGEVTEAQMEAELAKKANASGTYSALVAGLSENFNTSEGTTIEEPYNLKASGGNGRESLKKIIGVSVGWNQLVNTGATSVTVISGHKYYAKVNGVETVAQSSGTAISINDSSVDMVVDLPLAIGSTIADYVYSLETATAGAGVAWLKSHFPKMFGSYQPYDAGSIKSVTGLSAHKMTGLNQWDEEWEVGGISYSTGANTTDANNIRSKNYIPVFPLTDYYIKCPSSVIICGYDANKTFVKGLKYNVGNATFTTSNEAIRYIRFCTAPTSGVNYGNTYKNDICINFHYDGERDGEFEAYKEWSYPLDDSLTLRGILKMDASNRLYADGDTYEADGTVTRKYGIVDLGTLNWYVADSTNNIFRCTPTGMVSPATTADRNKGFISSKYSPSVDVALNNTMTDNSLLNVGAILYFRSTSYSDAATVKTAMSGVYLVYELATPTTETADPYTESQIVDNWGTEEFVSTSIVPVGNETFYLEDLKGKLEDLPTIPEAPTTNGTYVLKATVSGGVASYSWVAE